MSTPAPDVRPPAPVPVGVEILGVGKSLPSKRVTNRDLECLMDTTDEWITQRTGISCRWVLDQDKGESNHGLAAASIRSALADAGLCAKELDLLIVATCTGDMGCPSVACRVAGDLDIPGVGAFDLVAACSGFVYSLNVANDLIRGGSYKTIGIVGVDTLSTVVRYTDEGRGTAILFGDAAGAAVLRATEDTSKGVIAQSMHANGASWSDLYIPRKMSNFPEGQADESLLGQIQMNGREVFRFAVGAFPEAIAECLSKAGVTAEDVSMFICHQSNARILKAARERFGLPEEKLYVNIDRYGNTSAGSVPLCLYELRKAGRVSKGDLVMFVGFGGGLTWGTSLWRF